MLQQRIFNSANGDAFRIHLTTDGARSICCAKART